MLLARSAGQRDSQRGSQGGARLPPAASGDSIRGALVSTDDATRKLRSGSREPLLRVEGLSVRYAVKQGLLRRKVGEVQALQSVDLRLLQGQTIAVVGEAGAGKSTLVSAILRKLPLGTGRLLFEGKDLSLMRRAELRAFRGVVHTWSAAEPMPRDWLAAVRAVLAREPKLLIFDGVLDTLADGGHAVLEELRQAQDERGLTCLLLSRDLRRAAALADEVCVLLAGSVVETGAGATVAAKPQHPYSQQLAAGGNASAKGALQSTLGCAFRAHCQVAFARCALETPPPFAVPGGTSRCFLHDPGASKA